MPRLPSIRVIVALLMAAPVMIVAALLVILSSATAHRIAEDLGAQLVDHATATVQNDTRKYLSSAVRLSDLYARRLQRGELPITKLQSWEPAMLDDLVTNPDVASICFGNAGGEATWLLRHTGRLEVGRVSGGDSETNAVEYVVDAQISSANLADPIRTYHYDPRTRPWYEVAIADDKPAWTPIYFWFGDAGGDLETGTGYTRPIRNRQSDSVSGVLVIDVTLGAISGFLKRLPLAGEGAIFIIDDTGQLVASSRDAVNSTDGRRLMLRDNGDASAVAAADALQNRERDGRLSPGVPDRVWINEAVGGAQPARLRMTEFAPHPGLNWRIITVIPERVFLADAASVQKRSILMGVVASLGALALGLMLSRSISNPIMRVREHTKRIGTGDFESRLHLNAARELRDLSEDLNQMAGGLKERMELRQSLALANEVQQSLLPLAPPKLPGLDVAGQSRYCDTTGGDYFDYIDIAELPLKQTLVAVGDVMGHGIASALLMATARAALRTTALKEGSLAAMMTRVNEVLSRDARHNRFMTMDLVVVDPQACTVRWASAGHDPPMIFSPVRDAFRELSGGDLPLGVTSGIEYEEFLVEEVEPGSVIVIGTDGIWEAPNGQRELFGKKRLCELIRANAHETADGISEAINRSLAEFCGKDSYPDDVTFVVMKLWLDRG